MSEGLNVIILTLQKSAWRYVTQVVANNRDLNGARVQATKDQAGDYTLMVSVYDINNRQHSVSRRLPFSAEKSMFDIATEFARNTVKVLEEEMRGAS